MGNYTNICYSLALRHQLQHCYLSLNKETLPGEENDIGPGNIRIHFLRTCFLYMCMCFTPLGAIYLYMHVL